MGRSGRIGTPKSAASGGTPADGSITMAKLADLAQALIIGRAAGAGTGVPSGLTAAQVKTILDYGLASTEIKTGVRERDDMFYNLGYAVATTPAANLKFMSTSLSGTLSAFTPGALASVPSRPGIAALDTGTTTTGRAGLTTASTSISLGGGRARCGALVQIPTLSDGTQTFTVFAGFSDNLADAMVDAAYLRYSSGINSGEWQGNAIANSVAATPLDSNIPAVGATWYFLEVEVNAAGTSVEYFIDHVSVGTIATNIPTGAGRETAFQVGIVKSAGTTARTVLVDTVYLELDFTTPR